MFLSPKKRTSINIYICLKIRISNKCRQRSIQGSIAIDHGPRNPREPRESPAWTQVIHTFAQGPKDCPAWTQGARIFDHTLQPDGLGHLSSISAAKNIPGFRNLPSGCHA